MNIKNFGKGAIKTPKIIRDNHFRLARLAAIPPPIIDWSIPYSVENSFVLKQRNQNGSLSCTAQATSYYCEALEKIEHNKDENYSARFVYSQTYLPGGGTYIWKAMAIPLKIGAAQAESVPDKDSAETTMTDKSQNAFAQIEARADKYAVIPRSNIDQMAQIVKDYSGFITGFDGKNDMFSSDGTANMFTGPSEWGHAVYVCAYETRNGRKCLKFKNSWSSNWGSGGYGYFPEEFVNSGLMFDCYTYADLADLDPMTILTLKEVLQLQSLEGYSDPAGAQYWVGKTLDQYLTARIPDKIKTLQASL